MAGIDEIHTVNPTWRIDHTKEKDAKDGEKKKQKHKQPGSQKNQKPDNGSPHIDEYA